jgi:hypothetical protein
MKKEFFIIAFIKFAEIWANNNIGNNIQVDYNYLINYVHSDNFAFHQGWKLNDMDDCFKSIEKQILDGFPIWDFFVIPEWTRNMLEKEYQAEIEAERSPYVCFRCKYFVEKLTSFGTIYRCKFKQEVKNLTYSKGRFDLKESCKNFKEI